MRHDAHEPVPAPTPASALSSTLDPRSPDVSSHSNDHDDAVAATQPLKQFSFVQILGPQSPSHAQKVRKAVRVNAAKASAAARKKTIALRLRQRQHQQEQQNHALDIPRPDCAMPVPVDAPAADPAPPRLPSTSPPDQQRMSVTSSSIESPAPIIGHVAPHQPSDWKVHISNLLNHGTPSPPSSLLPSSPSSLVSASPSPLPDEPREFPAERISCPSTPS
nr:hypothetical protein CFP56_02684 [Quercus suber]